MTITTRVLDHIIFKGDDGALNDTIKAFERLGFTVYPGGTHAGGLTENALLLLQDAIYVELISFVHPISHYPAGSAERKARESHFWANKRPGWIDYANLDDPDRDTSAIVNERAQFPPSTGYKPAQAGGRVRKDGKQLEWKISVREQRGDLPFFCADVTPRDLRVPREPKSNYDHENTTKGISFVRVLVDHLNFHEVAKQISAVLDVQPSAIEGKQEITWKLQIPLADQSSSPLVILGVPRDKEEELDLSAKGPGIYEVGFSVTKDYTPGSNVPYGAKISWIVD